MVRKDAGRGSRVLQNRLTTRPELLASQSWRFVAYEVRVISSKKEALQTLSISKNVTWSPLTFRAKEIGESVDYGGKTLVNQRIRLRQFGVACCRRSKGSKLLDGVPALF
ncbi:MAG: hypothetical protein QOH35_3785 [Acidobacteriaceae bacterium]|nr:hypothetical protein [Acidobacteriaceae bacterium]